MVVLGSRMETVPKDREDWRTLVHVMVYSVYNMMPPSLQIPVCFLISSSSTCVTYHLVGVVWSHFMMRFAMFKNGQTTLHKARAA